MTSVDRISTLPDSVLCHILSFLPTKHAVATSILSNRWKALWLSVPTLDFDDQSYSENKDSYCRFVNFVYAVMLSRDLSQTLNRFRLKCRSSFCDPSNVNIWVNAAVQRKVEHLVLDLPHSTNLPPSVLKCRTLVVLELSGLTVDVLPSSFNFPSLKTLCLKRVRFGKHRYLGKLLSQCPIIEDLQMKSKISHKISLEELQSLPKLVRADIYHACIPLTAISNVEFLRTTVVFPFYMNIPIPTFHNLTQMELVFMSYGWGWLIKVLKDCPKLQILVIDERMTDSFSDDKDWAYPQSVPKCLSLCLRTCTIINYIGQKGELQFARYIMLNARLLRTMTIQSTSSSNLPAKLKMITDLSLCPRSSILCELSFK